MASVPSSSVPTGTSARRTFIPRLTWSGVGSVFRVKLFLPELCLASAPPLPSGAARRPGLKSAQPRDWVYPQQRSLDALQELVSLGYYRGILNKLDEIEAGEPHCAQFVDAMRALARQFQFEAMGRHLGPVAHDS